MLSIEIVQGNAFFQQRVELEGVNYTLDFAWNARMGPAGAWGLSLLSDEGALKVAGIVVVANRPLFRRFHYIDGVPPGELMFIDPTLSVPAPGFDGLTELIYFTKAEWDAR